MTATATELTLCLPVHWSVLLLAVCCLGIGAILGAWATTEAHRKDRP